MPASARPRTEIVQHASIHWDDPTMASCQQVTLLPLSHNLHRLLVWGDGDKLKCCLCVAYAPFMRRLCATFCVWISLQCVADKAFAVFGWQLVNRFFDCPVHRLWPKVPDGAI